MKKEVTIYIDERGWKYQVMPGIGSNTYKARYQKPGNGKWSCYTKLPWRDTPEAAEADLKTLADKKSWACCLSVSYSALKHIIRDRKSRGRFIAWVSGSWIAVDNHSGDAWTEEFPDLDSALLWLADQR